ncbi:phosphatase PAP2 family protein [Kitasatospora phosalacinea]|uniref:Phosphatase PAP2 family protein n=1 Tax=Kitasatospora phosalacinea TaxID=2065 RepID=A0A9W6US51_9ACTN|nr:phosphatase PAP2 family protein [Kitasatospora phosalacinea]GLW58213.1 phosphatase PAP2 family protein [Kitasatospora phosalacinea]
MTTPTPAVLALDGARIDGGLYTAVTDFAHRTPWLNTPMTAYTSYGIGLFALFMLAGWWLARRADHTVMAAALAIPIAAVLAYLLNDAVKSALTEPRPCRALPHDFILEACPPPNDWSLPSNHTTVAAATAAALLLVNRRLAALTALAALLMAASRVYVGAHYPHDVAAALITGSLTGLAATAAARRFAAPAVAHLRSGALRPILLAA